MDTLPISKLLLQTTHQLAALSDSPLLDAQLMLAHVLNKDRSYLMAWPEVILTQLEYDSFHQLVLQRLDGIPIAYILGYKQFWSMSFKVTPDVLIPRPDTELLVEQVIQYCAELDTPKILELGTGSGAIAIALGKELPKAHITATDISKPAIVIATQNSRTLAINNITFCHSDWFSNITKTFNIIVSNPPYIEIDDSHLANDIRHEPMMALVSGKDGLNDIRTIIKNSIHFLDDRGGNKGMLFLEHGYNQGTHVCELMKQAGFKDYKTIKDLASNDRVTFGSWSQR